MANNFLSNIIDWKWKAMWAICRSSQALAKKMVIEEEVKNARTIIEAWAWDWVFSQYIIQYAKKYWISPENIFIVEFEPDMLAELLQNIPQEYHKSVYCMDILDLPNLLKEKWINSVDLIVSWLPFVSMGKKFFTRFMNEVVWPLSHSQTRFKQFTYISPDNDDITLNMSKFSKYLGKILWLDEVIWNIPPAFVITGEWFHKKVWHIKNDFKITFHRIVTGKIFENDFRKKRKKQKNKT